MKYMKVILSIAIVALISVAVVGNVKARPISEEVEISKDLEPSTEVIKLDNVSNVDTLSTDDSVEVVTENSYVIEEDGVIYNFMFPTPDDSSSIIESINNCYEEEFTECVISYADNSHNAYLISIGTESFIITP